jgi:DNA-binding LacI/PurR family transcriptional regulator
MSKASGRTERARPAENSPDYSPSRYFTLADIAARAGVHVTTVSLALRDHPSIPPSTRARIRVVADEFGYRRDPLLDALNFHRTHQTQVQQMRAINSAFVVHAGPTRLFSGNHFQPLIHAGAKAAAAACGHSLDTFVVGPGNLTPARLKTIFKARGIHSVLLSSLELQVDLVDLDWDRFSAVKIECLHLGPHLDAVANDSLQAARLALHRLRELGYRRIGLVTAREDQQRLAESFEAGALIEQASLAEAEWVSPLVFGLADVSRLPALVSGWVRQQRVDAVISNWGRVFDALKTAGIYPGAGVAFASLDVPPGPPRLAGIVQNHHLVGRRAMEHLALMADAHQRGLPPVQTVACIPGYWQDGPTAAQKARPGSLSHPR